MKQVADIGLIGLAVMGQNLVSNLLDKGFATVVFNRTVEKVAAFKKSEPRCIAASSVKEFVLALKRPRKILLMVQAGQAVDDFIAQLLPYLEAGDVIIDGGNSLFTDSDRRAGQLAEKGLYFVGMGISGGEEGARHGPSLMPGGHAKAWPLIEPIFSKIAAQYKGEPCCAWVGDGGSGHYVKMVHNGIEYGDMQLICEIYHLLTKGLGLRAQEAAQLFAEWNEGPLKSFLVEITAKILRAVDVDGLPLVEKILDVAGQKGTGKWTGISSLELGSCVSLITEAVYARCLSSQKAERLVASQILPGPQAAFKVRGASLSQALLASKIISYAQGFALLTQAASEYKWTLNYSGIARLWREGCIIRSAFLDDIATAYENAGDLKNLMLDPHFSSTLQACQAGWRETVIEAIRCGLPTPCLSTALAYYDGYRSAQLPANLLQAQRDFFGAHTFERTDAPRGQFFHHKW